MPGLTFKSKDAKASKLDKPSLMSQKDMSALVAGLEMDKIEMPELNRGDRKNEFVIRRTVPYRASISFPVLLGTEDLDPATKKIDDADTPQPGYTQNVYNKINGELESFIGTKCDVLFDYYFPDETTAKYCNVTLKTVSSVDDALIFPFSSRINSRTNISAILDWLGLGDAESVTIVSSENEPYLFTVIKIQHDFGAGKEYTTNGIEVLICSTSSPIRINLPANALDSNNPYEVIKTNLDNDSFVSSLDPEARAYLYDLPSGVTASLIGFGVAIDTEVEHQLNEIQVSPTYAYVKPGMKDALNALEETKTLEVKKEKPKKTTAQDGGNGNA